MNIETLTVKELLDMFREYNKRTGKEYSLICLYDDGSGRIVHFSKYWSQDRDNFYNITDATSFAEDLVEILAGNK